MSFGGPGCWQGERSLPASEECQDLRGLLQDWVIRKAVWKPAALAPLFSFTGT